MTSKRQTIKALLALVDQAQRANAPQPLTDAELYATLGALVAHNNVHGRAYLPAAAREVLSILDDADERSVADGNPPALRRWTDADNLAALDAEIERQAATIAMRQRTAGYDGGTQADYLAALRRRRDELAKVTT